MQATSTLYREILSAPHWAEYRLCIYSGVNKVVNQDSLVRVKTSHGLFAGKGPTIGGCIAGEIDVELLAPAYTIPRMAQIQPMVRIRTETLISEWLPKGLFYIDTRAAGRDDPKTLRVHGYDSMLLAEEIWPSTSGLSFPATDADVVRLIAGKIRVDVDPRTWDIIAEAGSYTIPLPVSYTMREVLGYIGTMYAGNWIISDDNRLRLVGLADIPPMSSLILANPLQVLTVGRGDHETAILITAEDQNGGDRHGHRY